MKLREATALVKATRTTTEVRPSVRLDRTSNGSYTYGVTATGRSVHDAATKAMRAFTDLAIYVEQLQMIQEKRKNGLLGKALAESVAGKPLHEL